MVSLVRARYASNFITAMQTLGVPCRADLIQFGLDGFVLENPENMISANQLWGFAETAAKRAGKLDIGYDAGTAAALETYGAFGSGVMGRRSLFQRMRTFCTLARAEYSKADFFVRHSRRGLVFGRGPIDGNAIQVRQVELYVLTLMLEVIRSKLGQGWVPRLLSLQSCAGKDIEAKFPRTLTRFNCPTTEILIQDAETVRPEDSVSIRCDYTGREEAGELCISIEALIASYRGDRRLSLDFIADLADLHPRWLQRGLAKSGTSFSELVKRQRIERAAGALAKTDEPIAEIAKSLGYSDHAHFTRAFRNVMGMTPMRYRRSRHLPT